MRRRLTLALSTFALVGLAISGSQSIAAPVPRVIELTADRDSRYRQGRQASPTIKAIAGERLILRITAVRAREVARDGSIHGLALLDRNSNPVARWKFFLHPGVQDLEVTAPSQPGRYMAVCTVICSEGHEDMGFTLVVIESPVHTKEGK